MVPNVIQPHTTKNRWPAPCTASRPSSSTSSCRAACPSRRSARASTPRHARGSSSSVRACGYVFAFWGVCVGWDSRKHTLLNTAALMSKTMQEPRPRLKPTAPRMEVVRYTFDQHKDIFTLVRAWCMCVYVWMRVIVGIASSFCLSLPFWTLHIIDQPVQSQKITITGEPPAGGGRLRRAPLLPRTGKYKRRTRGRTPNPPIPRNPIPTPEPTPSRLTGEGDYLRAGPDQGGGGAPTRAGAGGGHPRGGGLHRHRRRGMCVRVGVCVRVSSSGPRALEIARPTTIKPSNNTRNQPTKHR